MKIRIRMEKKFITSETNNLPTNLLQNCSDLNYLLLNVFRFTPVINLILRIIFVYSFTLNFLILLFPTFCNKLILSPVYSFFPTFCNKWILSLTIFWFQVLGLFSSFGFVSNIPHTPRCLTPAPRFFVSEFWVCSRVLGLCRTFHTHTTMLNARPTVFVSEFWVCSRVLGLFRTFHTHTTMLNTRPTIFSFGVLGLLSSFGFVSNIPHTHHDA